MVVPYKYFASMSPFLHSTRQSSCRTVLPSLSPTLSLELQRVQREAGAGGSEGAKSEGYSCHRLLHCRAPLYWLKNHAVADSLPTNHQLSWNQQDLLYQSPGEAVQTLSSFLNTLAIGTLAAGITLTTRHSGH